MAEDAERVEGWARGIVAIADAEGELDRVEDELLAFAQAMDDNEVLRDALVDPGTALARRLEVVDELLGARAHPLTLALVRMVVASERGRDLQQIAWRSAHLAAAERQRVVATARTAVTLDDQRRERLRGALQQALGRAVELKVVVDPSVVGGLSVTVGDEIIDGTVARRLDELRGQLTGQEAG